MIIGYARVSTDDQDTAAQVAALDEHGCWPIFREKKSGGRAGRWDRPELHKALSQIKKGDTLVVWKLDRLSRSLSDLLHILSQLKHAEASFESLTERFETKSPAGRMVMHLLGTFAEFERDMLKERTKLGLARARAAGRIGGARFKLSPAQQIEAARMVRQDERTQVEVAKIFNVDRSTISRLCSEGRVLERKA